MSVLFFSWYRRRSLQLQIICTEILLLKDVTWCNLHMVCFLINMLLIYFNNTKLSCGRYNREWPFLTNRFVIFLPLCSINQKQTFAVFFPRGSAIVKKTDIKSNILTACEMESYPINVFSPHPCLRCFISWDHQFDLKQ